MTITVPKNARANNALPKKQKSARRFVFLHQLPPPKNRSVEDIKEAILEGPANSLEKVRKLKTYIAAKAEGIGTGEAKKLAGIKSGTNEKILSSPIAHVFVEEQVEKVFHDKRKITKLEQLWDAKTPITFNGMVTGMREDWHTQQEAFRDVLELQGYRKKKDDGANELTPVTIQFNTLSLPPEMTVVKPV